LRTGPHAACCDYSSVLYANLLVTACSLRVHLFLQARNAAVQAATALYSSLQRCVVCPPSQLMMQLAPALAHQCRLSHHCTAPL
jgi:hypothetical protein